MSASKPQPISRNHHQLPSQFHRIPSPEHLSDHPPSPNTSSDTSEQLRIPCSMRATMQPSPLAPPNASTLLHTPSSLRATVQHSCAASLPARSATIKPEEQDAACVGRAAVQGHSTYRRRASHYASTLGRASSIATGDASHLRTSCNHPPSPNVPPDASTFDAAFLRPSSIPEYAASFLALCILTRCHEHTIAMRKRAREHFVRGRRDRRDGEHSQDIGRVP